MPMPGLRKRYAVQIYKYNSNLAITCVLFDIALPWNLVKFAFRGRQWNFDTFLQRGVKKNSSQTKICKPNQSTDKKV